MQYRTLGALGASASVALALAGCAGAGPTTPGIGLTPHKIEQSIATSILSERHVDSVVSCPAQIPAETGYTFTCEASLDSGQLPVSVKELNTAGRVSWQNDAPLVILNTRRISSAIHASIKAERHLNASVACPSQILQQARVSFRCTATVGTKAYQFAVTETDNAGHVHYIGL